MTKAKLGAFLAISILITGTGTSVAIDRSAQQLKTTDAQPLSRPALTVKVLKPAMREIPLSLTAYGSIAAWEEAIIGSEVNGLRLIEVKAQIGEPVRKGQVLALFDDKSVIANVAQSRASLAEAEANLAEARIKSSHAQQISGSGALSELQIVGYATGQKTAEAQVQSAKAQLDLQLLQFSQTKVLASDEGIISARSATLGAVAGQGQELFRLIRQSRLEWRAEVGSDELAQLKSKLPVTVTVSGFGSVGGRVRTMAPTVDTQNRKALVYVDLPEAMQKGLRPGMFAQGEFALGVRSGISVPQNAICQRDGFNYVFRLDKQTGDQARVHQVKVNTGRYFGDYVEISAGLTLEDALVASGTCFLNDGDSVKVVQ